MVARTRRALRDKTQLPDIAKPTGPSTKARKVTAKKAVLQERDAQGMHALLDDERVFSCNAGISSRDLPALHSTPTANRKFRRHAPDLAQLSSPLPPSSPLATSSVNHADVEDDKFAYFATQSKLEAQGAVMKKTTESRRKYRIYDDSDIENMYATDEAYDTGVAPGPIAAIVPRLPSEALHGEPRSSGKCRVVDYATSTPGSSTPRLPSSPSPTKPRVAKASSAGMIKGKDVRRRQRKKVTAEIQQDEDEEMDSSMLMEHLESLLPRKPAKRPVRQVTRRTAKKRKAGDVSEASESEEQQTRKKGKRAPTTYNQKKPNVTNNKKRRKGEDPDLGLDKEQDKARRERIEYFKRLDEYELAKENVYVV